MTAVLIYVFYTDIWDELYTLLLPLKDNIAIDIALCQDNDNSKILQDLQSFNLIQIRYVENKGADIGPFLLQIQDLDSDKYPYFIKLHSKKSKIKNFEWRYVLFNTLIGSKDIFQKNIDLLSSNPMVGAITDPTMIMTRLANNKNHIKILCHTLNIKTTDNRFMAGSMFASRTKIFQKYFTKSFIDHVYPLLETGKVCDIQKGTFCHAMERIFGKIIHNEKLVISYHREDPLLTIYNVEHKKKFSIYKCYNNYCYTRSNKNLIFGYIYSIINDDSVVLNWTYLKDYQNYIRRYDKQTNGLFIGVS
jgi:hypothetical protein